jgi:hypothetical protein
MEPRQNTYSRFCSNTLTVQPYHQQADQLVKQSVGKMADTNESDT